MVQVAGALAYVHEKKYIHRDVKGDSVLVRADGSEKTPSRIEKR